MKSVALNALLSIYWLASVNRVSPTAESKPPRYTIVVIYESCTECADFSIDSGNVVVPRQFKQEFIEARYRQLRLYGTTKEQVAKNLASSGYRVDFLRAATEASFDSLYTPPGRTRHDTIPASEDPAIQASYWQKRYRLTGSVVGFEGRYLKFKVQKATLLPNEKGTTEK